MQKFRQYTLRFNSRLNMLLIETLIVEGIRRFIFKTEAHIFLMPMIYGRTKLPE